MARDRTDGRQRIRRLGLEAGPGAGEPRLLQRRIACGSEPHIADEPLGQERDAARLAIADALPPPPITVCRADIA